MSNNWIKEKSNRELARLACHCYHCQHEVLCARAKRMLRVLDAKDDYAMFKEEKTSRLGS